MTARVVKLDLGVIPSPAGSGELLLADEWNCRLVFMTADAALGRPRNAVATFRGCAQVVFGYPNDEATRGHPLYADWSYGFYEVLGSDWPARLEAQNRVAFPTSSLGWRSKRHFIVVCHEDLVEALADDVSVRVSDDSFEEVAVAALREELV